MATVINDTEHIEVEATLDDRWLMSPVAFESLTGWTLKPEGMCRAEACVPLPASAVGIVRCLRYQATP